MHDSFIKSRAVVSKHPLEQRHYDPTIGQFLTPDPIEDDHEHGYRYVGNSPTNAIDPDGLQTFHVGPFVKDFMDDVRTTESEKQKLEELGMDYGRLGITRREETLILDEIMDIADRISNRPYPDNWRPERALPVPKAVLERERREGIIANQNQADRASLLHLQKNWDERNFPFAAKLLGMFLNAEGGSQLNDLSFYSSVFSSNERFQEGGLLPKN